MDKRAENGFKKGRQKTGGRKKGSKNKQNSPAAERANELGVDPFEMLLLFASNNFEALGYATQIPMDMRLSAIKEACSYILPKKRSVEVVQDNGEALPERPFSMPNPKRESA